MPNEKNLIPMDRRSQSEARELGREGGIASGAARRREKRGIFRHDNARGESDGMHVNLTKPYIFAKTQSQEMSKKVQQKKSAFSRKCKKVRENANIKKGAPERR
ncbi:MAG: hypothetical protein ACI3V4_09730 [Faecousia sp.]